MSYKKLLVIFSENPKDV